MVKVKVLLGWMDEAEAMNTLLRENLTEPPLTEAEARALWEKYRERVAALPPRACRPPVRLTHCTRKEEYEVRYCIQKHRHLEQFREVVKLEDPGKLVVHQLAVTIPESEKYLRDMQDPDKRVCVCLGKGLQHDGVIPRARREGDCLVKPVPHFEFFVPAVNEDDFVVKEGNRYISVKEFDDRMLLAAGIHRAHVSMYRNNPDDKVLPLFAVLESDAVDGFFSEGTNAPAPFKRDMVRGARPPLLADFFDPNLCMELPQRRRRMVLKVDLKTRQWYRNWVDSE